GEQPGDAVGARRTGAGDHRDHASLAEALETPDEGGEHPCLGGLALLELLAQSGHVLEVEADGPLVVGTQPEAEELDAAARAEPDFELLGPQKMRLRLEDQLASLQCRGVLAPEVPPPLLPRGLDGPPAGHGHRA